MSGAEDWPLSIRDVTEARCRLRPYLRPTPLWGYPTLDAKVGAGISVLLKHENHTPVGSFKARNGLAALSLLGPEQRRRGVVTATRGNHGQGVAWAGRILGIDCTVCVPFGNNPEKNEAMVAWGAELTEVGSNYDEALAAARETAETRGLTMLHSTDDRGVLAGAATLSLEILEEAPALDALVLAVGGGSHAVGALTVARALQPDLEVYGVQAAAAPTIHDSWHAGERTRRPVEPTLADGLATGDVYEMTFDALREGLADFVTVTEEELAAAIRMLLANTHNLVEGGAAAGLAGLLKLRDRLAGKMVGIVLTGGNIDRRTLRSVLEGL